jgi:hypothetical protein
VQQALAHCARRKAFCRSHSSLTLPSQSPSEQLKAGCPEQNRGSVGKDPIGVLKEKTFYTDSRFVHSPDFNARD